MKQSILKLPFQMPRNRPLPETNLVALAFSELTSRLPSSWQVDFEGEPVVGGRASDGLIRLEAPDGSVARLVFEAKAQVDPKDVETVLSQVQRYIGALDAQPFVIAPFLSPRTQDRLAAAGAGFLDATGNLRLSLERPAVFLSNRGADRNPWRGDSNLRSLAGPAAARIVRALLDFPPPYSLREIAETAGASGPTASRVLGLLAREDLIERSVQGREVVVDNVDWPELLLRWTQDYDLQESNRSRLFLAPRGVARLTENALESGLELVFTGSLAARAYAREIVPPRLAVAYVPLAFRPRDRYAGATGRTPGDELEAAATELGLASVDGGGNVLLVAPFDFVLTDRARDIDGTRYAAAAQVAADLLTSPGRGPEEGEALVAWMRENDAEWRA